MFLINTVIFHSFYPHFRGLRISYGLGENVVASVK